MSAPPASSRHAFDFRGHRVAYESAGSGSPIVFLHNGGTSRRIWKAQLEFLAPGHRVYAMDLLGYGDSAKPDLEYTLPLYVSLLEEFVRHLGPEPVTLIGNCMGSAMALAYAPRFPERVRALVLFNTLTERTVAAGSFGSLYRLSARSGLVRRLLQQFAPHLRIPRAARAGAIKGLLGRAGKQAGVQRDAALQSLYESRDQLRVLNALTRNLGTYGELDALGRADIPVPVCSIWGMENKVLPAAAGRELCARLNPDRAEWLEDCGHLPMIEQPDKVNQIISCFLRESEGVQLK